MLNKQIEEIINLNNEFYLQNNESFDNSRNFGYWEGFEEILKYFPQNPKILDLACGNARFLRFLLDTKTHISSYIGVDSSKEFIQKNKLKYPDFEFYKLDALRELNQLKEKYSVVAVFGLTHHIPSFEFRKAWFLELSKLVESNGILVLSFWNFDTSKSDSDFKPNFYQIEKNDFFLGWKKNYVFHRYCHLFNQDELEEIVNNLKKFNLIASFEKDKNIYLILKKT